MAQMPLRDGDPSRIGGFRLVARLGAGGMGVVYLATAKDGAQVAVKVLRSELGDDADFRARFRREVALLARVQGLCTVRVVGADTESAAPFLATEYAPGPSLAEFVSQYGPLSADMLYGLATGLAEALTAIHAAGVIHRDLKPSNVLLTQAGPKVIDFGIAQALDSTAVTRTGVTVGSPGFMAPEQVMGQAGQPADIFTWGLTVAYAATGQSPFGTGPTDAVLYRTLHEEPSIPAIPEPLGSLIASALAKDPDARPQAPSILARLAPAGAQPGDPGLHPTQTVLARTWQAPPVATPVSATAKPRWRLPVLATAAALVAALAGAGAAITTGTPGAAKPSPTVTRQVAAPQPPSPTTSASLPAQPASPTTPSSQSASVTQVTSSPSRDVSGSYPKAEAVLGDYSYTPAPDSLWNSTAPLNEVTGQSAGAADGNTRVFFFFDGNYIGSDTPDGSAGVQVTRLSSTEFLLIYSLYNPSDPRCCPTGGTASVRFSWTGIKLRTLDPVPPTTQRG
jgi:serine/threonine protein kinase